jgi:hypothetical protein
MLEVVAVMESQVLRVLVVLVVVVLVLLPLLPEVMVFLAQQTLEVVEVALTE